jgi:hypothetical protein
MFISREDIGNRALQHVGGRRLSLFTDVSPNATEISFAYDKVRQAELRRNVWRFAIRRAVLRPLTQTMYRVIPHNWMVNTQYMSGALAVDPTGIVWASTQRTFLSDNTGNTPGVVNFNASPSSNFGLALPLQVPWEQSFVPLFADAWKAGTLYYAGDFVYLQVNGQAPNVYICNNDFGGAGNTLNPATIPAYAAGTTYTVNDVVLYNSQNWQCLEMAVLGVTPVAGFYWKLWNGTDTVLPANGWTLCNASLSQIVQPYPLLVPTVTGNPQPPLYPLPRGFLRLATQDAKTASTPNLETTGGLHDSDWRLDGEWLSTTTTPGPVILRFVADIANVQAMDGLFCEALAARLGLSVCERLTQSKEKFAQISSEYSRFIDDARLINRIEIANTDPAEEAFDGKPPAQQGGNNGQQGGNR